MYQLNYILGTEHHRCLQQLPFLPSPLILSHHPSIPLPFPPFADQLFLLFILPFPCLPSPLLTYHVISLLIPSHHSFLPSLPFASSLGGWIRYHHAASFVAAQVMPRCSSYYFMHFQNKS